ncbi:MAG TPA: 4-(cytidine 5'-diphospho)-2-C-methyl-D-erythritol kinase [Thermoanaerobaculia bacterium]|nr:4-(cytidine 5'-diphospho)-2-C-methyl-D-erythritol kinase [Thermoanaerobaculia bacterium]
MTLTAQSPCKINRELRVGRLRTDGYHEIRSRMVTIDLADSISAEESDRIELSCDDPSLPGGADNLVVRAAVRLAEEAGVRAGARLRLEKRVPAGGGLGGGSSDAACTLRLLAALWRLSVSDADLERVAAGLGSDVPFFLTGGEGEVSGRGERVVPLPDAPPADLILLVPPFSVSTAAVYREYAGRGTLPERLALDEKPATRYLGPNDLAPAVLVKEPKMEAYVRSAAEATPDWAISGSGATIVLHGAGPAARDELSRRHPDARVIACRSLSRADYIARTRPTGGAR